MTPPNEPSPIARASRWRCRVAAAHPEREDRIAAVAATPVDRERIAAEIGRERGDAWRDEAHLMAGLRRVRTTIVAALLDRDLDRRADLGEVVDAMTALAETAIGEALPCVSNWLAARHGIPHRDDDNGGGSSPQDLFVVGMGKLGGGELNVSSDIDLIFLYEAEGSTRGASGRALSAEEFFTRVGRKLIAVLSETTADGFVFRVDMRLRPDGDSGPLVMHLGMLERYLVASARDWERFAWIKARCVSPPVFASGDGSRRALDEIVTPFVYRRYLDFGAIDALRRLHGQIRDEAARRDGIRQSRGSGLAVERIDVKLGRGGIREIEFIAQHFQLVRGGREPWLRLRGTRETLVRLADDGLVERDVGDRLRTAYAFLRDVEHRLQYLDDAQTHTLPSPGMDDERTRLATMCAPLLPGPDATFDDLVAELQLHRAFVETQFDAIFRSDAGYDAAASVQQELWTAIVGGGPATHDDAADSVLCDRLRDAGVDPPDAPFARLAALARGARLRAMAPGGRARLDALIPRLIEASTQTDQPSATLARWIDLVEAIAGRSAYLALLDEYPRVRMAVTRLLASSPWAAQYLVRHPLLLDELIDAPDRPAAPRDADAWAERWRVVAVELERRLEAEGPDAERQMDRLRETHHVETFLLLIEDLAGRLTVEMLSDQLSALADLVIEAAIRHAWCHFASQRTDAPAVPAFTVVAYGKLGGKELGYASDLDLVFLFDPQGDAEAAAVYARFAQRLGVWLTARTAAGSLFDIDLRLRPDGAAGLVASSFDAWSRYERRDDDLGAWTWEHQALTRARFCAGDRALGDRFEAERVAILTARDVDDDARHRLRVDIVAMRQRMHDGHPNRSGRFDLKHDEGGMVDIEFAVQYVVLAYGRAHPALLPDVGNIALLARAAQVGLIGAETADAAAGAYRRYRARQHALRLAEPGAPARVDAEEMQDERRAVRALWTALFGPSDV